jgi:hypothetical protein
MVLILNHSLRAIILLIILWKLSSLATYIHELTVPPSFLEGYRNPAKDTASKRDRS